MLNVQSPPQKPPRSVQMSKLSEMENHDPTNMEVKSLSHANETIKDDHATKMISQTPDQQVAATQTLTPDTQSEPGEVVETQTGLSHNIPQTNDDGPMSGLVY